MVDNYCEVAAAGKRLTITRCYVKFSDSRNLFTAFGGILALIIYESIIITGQEARYFWSERLTGAAVLFYLNKYLTLLSFVYTMCGFVTGISDKVRRIYEPRGYTDIQLTLAS